MDRTSLSPCFGENPTVVVVAAVGEKEENVGVLRRRPKDMEYRDVRTRVLQARLILGRQRVGAKAVGRVSSVSAVVGCGLWVVDNVVVLSSYHTPSFLESERRDSRFAITTTDMSSLSHEVGQIKAICTQSMNIKCINLATLFYLRSLIHKQEKGTSHYLYQLQTYQPSFTHYFTAVMSSVSIILFIKDHVFLD